MHRFPANPSDQETGRFLENVALSRSFCSHPRCSHPSLRRLRRRRRQPKRIAIYDELQYRPGESAAWRLDLAMPENFGGELHPAIVIIHGGGWRSGSRRDRPYRSMLTEYALKGYVTLSIDYRLLGEAPMEEMIEDVDCAVRWLRAHAND